jgi:uncharacterized protein
MDAIPMRRKDKEISDRAAMEAVIAEATACRVAMVDGGRPYLVPMSFGYKDNAIYFHSARQGRKIDILKKNPSVCVAFDVNTVLAKGTLACDWGIRFRSVICFGRAVLVDDPDEKRAGLDTIMAQYSKETHTYSEEKLRATRVIRVDIDEMTGKASG